MTGVRLTDERLRTYLNTRQSDRERMCLALLKLDARYSQIEPRRPEGGPDGGRDIQCLFQCEKCFGAVGFKNNAKDSDEEWREIRNKFIEDLHNALQNEPDLFAFVFFTNVDLTPAKQQELNDIATRQGINHLEIYWRERMRILLDSPEGYAIRYSFLDISLSDAEQKVFFSKFGDELQNVIANKVNTVVETIEEIQFRNWLRGRCRDINVVVKLKELYRVEGCNHEPYRFALRLHQPLTIGNGILFLGCFSVVRQGQKRADFERKSYVYSDSPMLPNERCKHTIFPAGTRVVEQPFDEIVFGIRFSQEKSITSDIGVDLSELRTYVADLYCDTAWVSKIDRVEVWYDDYLVQEFVNNGKPVRFKDVTAIEHWPVEAAELADRPIEFWDGWGPRWDRVCRRKRISER